MGWRGVEIDEGGKEVEEAEEAGMDEEEETKGEGGTAEGKRGDDAEVSGDELEEVRELGGTTGVEIDELREEEKGGLGVIVKGVEKEVGCPSANWG